MSKTRRVLQTLLMLGTVSLVLPETVLAAGGDLPSLVHDIGYAILLAGILAIAFTAMRIPTIAAFLVAGVIIGPIGAKLVTDPGNIDTIAQLGLVLLLFLIGLELDLRKLLASGKTLIITGLLQYPLSVAFGFGVAKLLLIAGIGTGLLASGPYVALYIGFIMAASSTLLVVKLFQESFQMDTLSGRVSLGILIFQDIWAIIVIALQPNFDNPSIGPILLSFLGIGVLILIAVLLAKYILPIGFRWIAKMPELILVASVAWCFFVVFLGGNLDTITERLMGFNLHMAVGAGMGALIAGASIANLPYATEVVGKVGIVKDFFVTLFFVGLGMGIPAPEGVGILLLALLLAAIALLARFVLFFPLLYVTGLDRRNAMMSSVRLAQVSEFTLVIAYAGLQLNHISSELNAVIIFAFVFTALLTPTLYKKADDIHTWLSPILSKMGFKTPVEEEAADEESYSIALLGFHREASSLLHELKEKRPDLLSSTLVVDYNVNIHKKIAEHGPTVRYGDLANTATLHHSGVDKAKVIVCTIHDDLLKGTSNRKIVEALHHINPDATIIVNAIELSESKMLYESGADFVYMPRIETAKSLLPAIEASLTGTIQSHRSQREAEHGRWHERDEVFS